MSSSVTPPGGTGVGGIRVVGMVLSAGGKRGGGMLLSARGGAIGGAWETVGRWWPQPDTKITPAAMAADPVAPHFLPSLRKLLIKVAVPWADPVASQCR